MAEVVAVVGSSRKAGNTEMLAAMMLEIVAARGFSTELIPLAGRQITNCDGCDTCRTRKLCHIEDDFQEIYPKLVEARGIILASPVYSFGPTPQILALGTRTGRVARATGDPRNSPDASDPGRSYYQPSVLARKVGAAIAVARRAGGTETLALLNHFFLRNHMFLVGSVYPNVAFGYHKGDALKDEEGVANLRMLAANFAWLLERLHR